MKYRMHSNPFVPAVLFLCLFALVVGSTSCTAVAAKKKSKSKTAEKAPEIKPNFKIIAYYFHGNFRCATCKKLEAFSDEAIKAGFPQELKDGVIEWRVVNVEEKGNEHFIEDYKMYSKSLVLVEMDGDKQVKWKNLEKIWELVKDKNAFIKYVQDEVKVYLKDVPKKPEKKERKKDSK
jgi:hypothetical protein